MVEDDLTAFKKEIETLLTNCQITGQVLLGILSPLTVSVVPEVVNQSCH